uniref:uncharacterized protein isoform X2 n=1 Tax=Myxine glutinosa TaxID=7769 RepID=UPI00358E0F44
MAVVCSETGCGSSVSLIPERTNVLGWLAGSSPVSTSALEHHLVQTFAHGHQCWPWSCCDCSSCLLLLGPLEHFALHCKQRESCDICIELCCLLRSHVTTCRQNSCPVPLCSRMRRDRALENLTPVTWLKQLLSDLCRLFLTNGDMEIQIKFGQKEQSNECNEEFPEQSLLIRDHNREAILKYFSNGDEHEEKNLPEMFFPNEHHDMEHSSNTTTQPLPCDLKDIGSFTSPIIWPKRSMENISEKITLMDHPSLHPSYHVRQALQQQGLCYSLPLSSVGFPNVSLPLPNRYLSTNHPLWDNIGSLRPHEVGNSEGVGRDEDEVFREEAPHEKDEDSNQEIRRGMVFSGMPHHIRKMAVCWTELKESPDEGKGMSGQAVCEGVLLHKRLVVVNGAYRLGKEWEKVSKLLGHGRYGNVHVACDVASGFTFAVKQEELVVWSQLDSPHLVQLFGTVRLSSSISLFMQLVEGGTLEELINDNGQLPEDLVLHYTCQMLEGLAYLHRQNIVHGDIKAANMLTSADGQRIWICDFGLSQRLLPGSKIYPSDQQPLGTQTHMAPEVAASAGHDVRADVWSVSCTMLHMLTGRHPWVQRFPDMKVLYFVIVQHEAPLWELPSSCSPVLVELLSYGLQKNMQERPSAALLLRQAQLALSELGGLSTAISIRDSLVSHSLAKRPQQLAPLVSGSSTLSLEQPGALALQMPVLAGNHKMNVESLGKMKSLGSEGHSSQFRDEGKFREKDKNEEIKIYSEDRTTHQETCSPSLLSPQLQEQEQVKVQGDYAHPAAISHPQPSKSEGPPAHQDTLENCEYATEIIEKANKVSNAAGPDSPMEKTIQVESAANKETKSCSSSRKSGRPVRIACSFSTPIQEPSEERPATRHCMSVCDYKTTTGPHPDDFKTQWLQNPAEEFCSQPRDLQQELEVATKEFVKQQLSEPCSAEQQEALLCLASADFSPCEEPLQSATEERVVEVPRSVRDERSTNRYNEEEQFTAMRVEVLEPGGQLAFSVIKEEGITVGDFALSIQDKVHCTEYTIRAADGLPLSPTLLLSGPELQLQFEPVEAEPTLLCTEHAGGQPGAWWVSQGRIRRH